MPDLLAPQDLAHALHTALPAAALPLLQRMVELADAQTLPIYVVGGVVRDLLLRRAPGPDIDLTVVGAGSAVWLGQQLAHETGAVLTRHETFGTATLRLQLPDQPPIELDLVTARRERYPAPAVLPLVEPAGLHEDLLRRDFCINTLAWRLGAFGEGTLVDLCDGLADLRTGVLRVLHAASFRDDPTRILRGVRIAARLQYAFAPRTDELARHALAQGYLALLSPERVWAEVELLLAEPDPFAALALAHQLGLDAAMHPALATQAHPQRLLDAPADPLLRLGLWLYDLDQPARREISSHYRLPSAQSRLLAALGPLRELVRSHDLTSLPASRLDTLLQPFDDPALQVLALAEPHAAPAIARYREQLRPWRSDLNGTDLLRLGIPAGPGLGKLLAALRAARLDGRLQSRADEERFVQEQRQQCE